MVILVKLRIEAHNPYSGLSKTTNSGNVQLHCNDYVDMLIFDEPINEETMKFLVTNFTTDKKISVNIADPPYMNYLMIPCACATHSQIVLTLILKNNGVLVSPVKYEGDWEYYEFFCINKNDLADILDILTSGYTCEIISSREFGAYFNPLKILSISATDLFKAFNPKQIALLKEAYQSGYYAIPRKIKLADIADNHDKSRWTVEKTLRKIENRIMDMIVPLVEFGEITQKMMISEN